MTDPMAKPAQRCIRCDMRVDFLDDELRDSFCTGSRYGTHTWVEAVR